MKPTSKHTKGATEPNSAISQARSSGFQFGTIECRYFPRPSRAVVDMELIYINKGEGLCFSGDGISRFSTGDLLFFSANTPHYLQSANQFYQPNYPLRCGATYLRFSSGILPTDYPTLPDCSDIKRLIESGNRGIKWTGKSIDDSLIEQIETMEQVQGFERFVRLLSILNRLGGVLSVGETISSESKPSNRSGSDRAYNMVLEYISHNFRTNITLDELAEYTDMNRSALCRHFRSRADRSIFDYLLTYRIQYASHQLATTHLPVAEIAIDSGFNNLPNFNVQFKRTTGVTPSNYRIQAIIK